MFKYGRDFFTPQLPVAAPCCSALQSLEVATYHVEFNSRVWQVMDGADLGRLKPAVRAVSKLGPAPMKVIASTRAWWTLSSLRACTVGR